MAIGHVWRRSRAFGCLLLIYFTILLKTDCQDYSNDGTGPPNSDYHRSCQTTPKSWKLNPRNFHLKKWRTHLSVIARVKRSKAASALYSNSTSTFRPIIQLIHDIETNPGPSNYSVDGRKKTTSSVKIAHLNVRSLKCRDHYVLVKETILANKFDIFTISESWLDNLVTDLEMEVPGYDIYRVDRQNKKGGGICAYVLRTYKTEVLKNISQISPSGFHQLWIKVQTRNLKSIVVCTAYRPPGTPLSCFDTDLTANFISVLSFNLPIYILGDLNCNLLNSEGQDSRALINFCHSYNLSQLIKTPTRVTESSKSILDIILTSDEKQVQKAFVIRARSVIMI